MNVLICTLLCGFNLSLVSLVQTRPLMVPDYGHFNGGVTQHVDEVRVIKHERKLFLLSHQRIVREYSVSLGSDPVGTKRRSGDGRTPEGDYTLDWRNSNSRYHRSIHISYPSSRDRAQATQNGWNAGGDIMIHGLPNGYGGESQMFKGRDWTDGCVAMRNNAAMDELWSLVADGTPIEILP